MVGGTQVKRPHSLSVPSLALEPLGGASFCLATPARGLFSFSGTIKTPCTPKGILSATLPSLELPSSSRRFFPSHSFQKSPTGPEVIQFFPDGNDIDSTAFSDTVTEQCKLQLLLPRKHEPTAKKPLTPQISSVGPEFSSLPSSPQRVFDLKRSTEQVPSSPVENDGQLNQGTYGQEAVYSMQLGIEGRCNEMTDETSTPLGNGLGDGSPNKHEEQVQSSPLGSEIDEYDPISPTGPVSYLGELVSDPVRWKKSLSTHKGLISCRREKCRERFPSMAEYALHADTKHRSDGPFLYPCSHAGCVWSVIGFPFKAELTRHVKNQHEIDESRLCVCDDCGRVFKRSDSLRRHLRSCGVVKPVKPRVVMSVKLLKTDDSKDGTKKQRKKRSRARHRRN